MSDDLYARIKQREQQAIDRKIGDKISRVYHNLDVFGAEKRYEWNLSRDNTEIGYTHEGLTVLAGRRTSNSHFDKAEYKGQIVFYSTEENCGWTDFQGIFHPTSESISITTYIPGEWENILDGLYDKVQAYNKNRQPQSDPARDAELRKNFGL